MKKIWFKRKEYGWGWYPVTKEGWAVIIIWLGLFLSLSSTMDHEWLKNLVFIFVMTGILIYICYKKGETPRWQWGKKKE